MADAPSVTILGKGHFAGRASNISNYTVNEDATPLSLHSLTGGVGGITFDAIEDPNPDGGTILLRGQEFRLKDPFAGSQVGVIDTLENNDLGILKVTANGSLSRTVVHRKAPAYNGTVGGALMAWFALCGWTPSVRFDSTITNQSVTLPAWEGEVWAQIKKLAVIRQFDITEIDGIIVVRALRTRWIDFTQPVNIKRTTANPPASHAVEVYYYNNSYQTLGKVYPLAGEYVTEGRILQVEAGETVTTNLPVNMWINTLSNLTQVTQMAQTSTPAQSTYAVVDKDGKPVTPSDWVNAGGSASIAIGADRKSIDITITGMSTTARGPYRIASSSSDRTYQYPALFLRATGVAFSKQMISSHTGAGASLAAIDSVTTIDDPMVSSISEAGRVLDAALVRLSGHGQSITVGATKVNRRGETGLVTSISFTEWNVEYSDETFDEYDLILDDITFDGYNQEQVAERSEDFVNQAFGSMGGARVRDRDTVYRVITSTAGPDGFSWTAEFDTTFTDFNDVWDESATFDDFNFEWDGRTFMEQAASPLWRA